MRWPSGPTSPIQKLITSVSLLSRRTYRAQNTAAQTVRHLALPNM
jgi:hypothetical protein